MFRRPVYSCALAQMAMDGHRRPVPEPGCKKDASEQDCMRDVPEPGYRTGAKALEPKGGKPEEMAWLPGPTDG